MGMLFLRYQEYYESTNNKFRGIPFKIFDYMEWYVKHNKKKSFTYPEDFVGYNIPSEIIFECLFSIPKNDNNNYDFEMELICDKCNKASKDKPFYLIAGADTTTFKHELAHGLWYTNIRYRLEMIELLNNLPTNIKLDCYKKLSKHYTKEVLPDELQAYMATGLSGSIGFLKTISSHRKKFVKVFNEYTGTIGRNIVH